MKPMPSARELEALKKIRVYIEVFGRAPMQCEIAEALGVSRTRANQLCRKLKRHGLIDYELAQPRSLRVLYDSRAYWLGVLP